MRDEALQYPIELTREQILALLPHRHDMQLVDSVTVVSDDHFVGRACWDGDARVLQGHFPGMPVVPGVLLVELAAQVAGAGMLAGSREGRQLEGRSVGMLAGIRKCSFKRPVLPDERVEVEVHSRAMSSAAAAVSAVVRVGGDEAAQIEILVISTPREGLEHTLSALRRTGQD